MHLEKVATYGFVEILIISPSVIGELLEVLSSKVLSFFKCLILIPTSYYLGNSAQEARVGAGRPVRRLLQR